MVRVQRTYVGLECTEHAEKSNTRIRGVDFSGTLARRLKHMVITEILQGTIGVLPSLRYSQ